MTRVKCCPPGKLHRDSMPRVLLGAGHMSILCQAQQNPRLPGEGRWSAPIILFVQTFRHRGPLRSVLGVVGPSRNPGPQMSAEGLSGTAVSGLQQPHSACSPFPVTVSPGVAHLPSCPISRLWGRTSCLSLVGGCAIGFGQKP